VGLGLNCAFRVLVIDVAAHAPGIHSCRERWLGWQSRSRQGSGEDMRSPLPTLNPQALAPLTLGSKENSVTRLVAIGLPVVL
jgi:hypothetical protein